MKLNILALLVLTSLCNVGLSQHPPLGDLFTIQWDWIYTDDFFMSTFEPAGAINGQRVYLARGKSDGSSNWISGYLQVRDKVRVRMANNGHEIVSDSFQVLKAPRGSLSWIPIPQNRSVPKGAAIFSGMSDTGRTQYVCRAASDRNIIPGKYAENTGRCYVAIDGKEVGIRTGELLVENSYGFATAVDNETGDQSQIKDDSESPNNKSDRDKDKHNNTQQQLKLVASSNQTMSQKPVFK